MNQTKLLIIALFSLSLVGCFSAVTMPQKKLYTLTPKILKIKKYPISHKTLLVMSTQANDSVDKKKMAYIKQPYQLSYFSYNAWASNPSDQITGLVTSALRNTHYFKGVVRSPYVGTTDFKLSTHLTKLQQNFLFNPSHEQLELSAQLIKVISGEVIAERTFTYSIKTQHNNPYGGVLAANQAVKRLLQDLTRLVVHSISRS